VSVPNDIYRYFEMSDEHSKNNLTSLLEDIDDLEAPAEHRERTFPDS
jgi:hypothetical protein